MEAPSVEPKGAKSDRGSEFSQTSFETGGRTALNLHGVEQWTAGPDGTGGWAVYIGDEKLKGWSGQGRAFVTGLREIDARKLVTLHGAAIAQTLQSAQAASDGKEQGTSRQPRESPEDVERDVRRICEELDRGQQLTERDLELRVSSSSSATVRGPMEEAYGAWREADDLIIVKLPGLEEFRISNEGAERLHADFAKICRAPSGIEGQPAQTEFREALDIVLRDRDALHDQYEKDIEFLNEQFDGIPVSHLAEEGWEETVRCLREIGKKLTEIRTRKWSFGSSPPSPPLPDNGEAVQTKGLEE